MLTQKDKLIYTAYRQKMLDKFKSSLRDDELEDLKIKSKNEFCLQEKTSDLLFDNWLIEKGIVPVPSLKEWLKNKNPQK